MIIKGKVKRGKGIGKTLGYPTANVDCDLDLSDGVFYSLSRVEKDWLPSVLIKGVLPRGVEIYLIDWSGDLYGKEIEVEIFDKIRNIIHFKDPKELVKQIEKDVEFVRSRYARINTQKDAEFLYKDITYKIRGACFEVYKNFGGAFKEKIIENALVKELLDMGLDIDRQKRIDIFYKDKKVGVYVPDLIVNGVILVELKCKPQLTIGDERQFWLYLKGTKYKLGLLINFGSEKLEIKRRIYERARDHSV
jgi:GxxExxY protein